MSARHILGLEKVPRVGLFAHSDIMESVGTDTFSFDCNDIFLRTFLSCQVSTPVPLREYHLPSLEISASAYVWHYQFPIARNLVYLA